MLLGVGLVAVGGAVLYYAVTGNDPRLALKGGVGAAVAKVKSAPSVLPQGQRR